TTLAMRSTIRVAGALAAAAFLTAPVVAQTYTNCNPTSSSGCQADSALGKTVNIAFTSASDSFTPQGNPTYGSDGVSLTVAKSGDAPQLTSKWYIMFGQVDVELETAPGAGIVSSFVLQSDCLDEIDWEWLGADNAQAQSNYFGKGQTTTYNRGAFHANTNNQNTFQKYTIIWTSEQIVWQINGVTVRTLKPADSDNQYPQTPMQIKIGAWSGGDSANSAGTISWARGPTDYSQGPFIMKVKSLKVQDYSTGTSYSYGDQSGTWTSIQSNGGKISAGGTVVQGDSAITSAASGQPMPFKSSYPWVPTTTVSSAPAVTETNYPGLPSGWTVSDSGKVVPPSLAPVIASSTSPSQASPWVSSAGSNQVITTYDDKGFTTVYTVAAGRPTLYDSKGFPVTTASSSSVSANANVAENNVVATTPGVSLPASTTSNAFRLLVNGGLVLLAASVGVLM
ncbi:hypothetical protein P280DRAFT_401497, partial [Massarina eburnea CBS 473.64]